MLQTRFNTLYVCEIKFSRNPLGPEIIEEIKAKISKLKIPKLFSVRAVLIHVGEISSEITDSLYFANIIDFASLLATQD